MTASEILAAAPMTDPAVVLAAAQAATAAQSAASQAALIGLIALMVQTAGAIGIAWIGFKTAGLGKVMNKLEVNTNSIKDALVKKTGESEFARGVLEEKARAEAEKK